MGRYTEALEAVFRQLQDLGEALRDAMSVLRSIEAELQELREELENSGVIEPRQAPRDVCPICGAFLWEDDDGRLICPRHGLVRFKC